MPVIDERASVSIKSILLATDFSQARPGHGLIGKVYTPGNTSTVSPIGTSIGTFLTVWPLRCIVECP